MKKLILLLALLVSASIQAAAPSFVEVTNIVTGMLAADGVKVTNFFNTNVVNVLNVKSFGVNGSGNETDGITNALNSAITNRLPLYFPTGTYQMSVNNGYIVTNMLEIVGDGTNSVLTWGSASASTKIIFKVQQGGLKIRNMTLGTAWNHVLFDTANLGNFGDIVFDNVTFSGARNSVYSAGPINTSLWANRINFSKCSWISPGSLPAGQCVLLKGVRWHQLSMKDCFLTMYPMGITVGDDNSTTLQPNMMSSDQTLIEGNSFYKIGGDDSGGTTHASQAIEVYMQGVQIRGNSFRECGTPTQSGESSTVYIKGAGTVVDGNTFMNNGIGTAGADIDVKGPAIVSYETSFDPGVPPSLGAVVIRNNFHYISPDNWPADRGAVLFDSDGCYIENNTYMGYSGGSVAKAIISSTMSAGSNMRFGTRLVNNRFLWCAAPGASYYIMKNSGLTGIGQTGVEARGNWLYACGNPSQIQTMFSITTGVFTNVIFEANQIVNCTNTVGFQTSSSATIHNLKFNYNYAGQAAYGLGYFTTAPIIYQTTMLGNTADGVNGWIYAGTASLTNFGYLIASGNTGTGFKMANMKGRLVNTTAATVQRDVGGAATNIAYLYCHPAQVLNVNGDYVEVLYRGKLDSDANTKQIKAYWGAGSGGTLLFDSTAKYANIAAFWELQLSFKRASSSTAICSYKFKCIKTDGTVQDDLMNQTATLTGLSFTADTPFTLLLDTTTDANLSCLYQQLSE